MLKTALKLILLAGILSPETAAQKVSIYRPYPSEKVEASASSNIPSSPASNAVNGSGMSGEYHVANNLGEGMWVSKVSKSKVRYHKSTHEGAVWFVCTINGDHDAPAVIDRICIWNHNQNEHTRRGLNKVWIEYSVDGEKWALLPNGKSDFHLIPESVGKNPEGADYDLTFPAIKAKYICITAASDGEGNHYDRKNPIVMREAKDMHQNPDYYGLAEIRFYRMAKVDVGTMERISTIEPMFSQGYLRTDEGPKREFALKFDKPLYAGGTLSFNLDGKKWDVKLSASAAGLTRYDGLFPVGYMNEKSRLTVKFTSRQGNTTCTAEVPAARKWTVSFFPHSHQDIGYTHRQDDVMKLQWRNLERAIELAERTKDYPEESRFHWNTEATWSIAGYLKEYAGTDKAQRVIDAVREGSVCINAALGSELTGISRQEELMHMFDDAHSLETLTGVPCNTAMMSDVPGQVWGMVTAMAKNGVRYYSPGPNYVPFYGKIGNDRTAALHIDWGDRPFYWQSQSGTDKVLVWEAGRGYSWFHGWLAGRLSVCGVEPIWQYLEELETDRFPYNTCYLRYTVHGDNGPPDELMPDVIREWNERYESPTFVISSSAEFFENFEKEYGDVLPVYSGDMTPTWEDGAASTARETADNRESAARLARTNILWAMYATGREYPAYRFDEAWKNVVLFSEHTWGASASGSQPDSEFTKDLWFAKKAFGDSAVVQSKRLLEETLPIDAEGNYIHVANTALWPRTDVVTFDGPFDADAQCVTAPDGHVVDVQLLDNGRWAFIAENIAPLSSAVYKIEDRKASSGKSAASMVVGNFGLDNGLIRLTIDSVLGTISSLRRTGDDYEYASGKGLNDYLYTGRMAASPQGAGTVRGIQVVDDGPVAATLRIESDAPGCNSLTRYITLYHGIDRVDIVNVLDKKDIREWENVRFLFPFNIPHAEISFDMAMSEVHPEREQLSGVNKHYYCIQNGLSVRDLEHGVCLTAIDAPFVEMGSPSGEDYRLNPRYGYGWWRSAQLSPDIYSWVMTNTWRTNYKASQGGPARFRYTIEPCNPHDTQLKQRGYEREHPLECFRSASASEAGQLFRLSGNNKIALSGMRPSKDGNGYIIRLQNLDNESVNTSFIWGAINGISEVSLCDWREQPLRRLDTTSFWMKPYEYMEIKVNTK